MFPAAFMGGMGGMGMAPAYSGLFPMGRRLPAKPNPLVNPPKPNYAHADVAGIQQALQKRSAVCHSALNPSAVGESGLSSRYDDEGQLRGKAAFESLGKYLKTAGLNPFQAAFFAHAVIEGLTEPEVQHAVKRAGDQFGPEVAAELQNGLEKLAGGFLPAAGRMAWSGIKGVGRGLGKFITNPVTQTLGAGAILHGAGDGLNETAIGARTDMKTKMEELKGNLNSHAERLHANAENTSNDLRQRFGQMQEAVTRNADLAGKSSSGFFDNANQTLSGLRSGFGGATDFLRNNPMLALLAAGGGLGGLMGGGRGALAGGIGLPLLYMLMQGGQGGKNPLSALSSYFGGAGAGAAGAAGAGAAGAGAAPGVASRSALTGVAPPSPVPAAKPQVSAKPQPFSPMSSTPKYPVSPMGMKPPLGGVKPPQSFVPVSSTPKYPASPVGPVR